MQYRKGCHEIVAAILQDAVQLVTCEEHLLGKLKSMFRPEINHVIPVKQHVMLRGHSVGKMCRKLGELAHVADTVENRIRRVEGRPKDGSDGERRAVSSIDAKDQHMLAGGQGLDDGPEGGAEF